MLLGIGDRAVQLDAAKGHRMRTAYEEPAHVADNSPAPETAGRSRPVRLIILCGVLLVVAIAVGTGIMLSNLRNRALNENEREVQNMTLVLAKQIDRDFFLVLQSDEKLNSVISKPIRSRATGTWIIQIARKVSGPNGEFLGLVLGAIKLQSIEQYFARIVLGPDSAITLLHRDGELMARYPRIETLIDRKSVVEGKSVDLGGRR